MPVNKSALKRERQNITRRDRNRILRTKVRTSFNKVMESIHAKKKTDTVKNFNEYSSIVDRAVKKSIFHRNKGARRKSRMAKLINNTFKAKKSA